MEINIEEEQKKVREKIEAIEKSGIFKRIEEFLQAFGGTNIESQNRALIGRIKKPESACEKIERQGLPASQMYDLVGFMYIVDLPEEYMKAKEVMHEGMPKDSFEHDFDGNLPENSGYSSFHMGVNKDRLEKVRRDTDPSILDGLSIEIQLKSMGMYIAQEATHDTIYKNPELKSEDEKNVAQAVMFPLIEKIVNREKYKQCLDTTARKEQDKKAYFTEMIAKESKEIDVIIESNKDFFDKKPKLVEQIFCEFIVAQYEQILKKEPFLKDEETSTKEVKEHCKNAIKILMPSISEKQGASESITGFPKIDNLYDKIMNFSISQLHELSDQQKQQEDIPPILEETIKMTQERISSKDIKAMSSTILKVQEEISQDSFL